MKETIAVPAPPSAPSSAPKFTPYQKTVVGILTVLQFTIVLDFMIISPLSDILIKSIGLKTEQFGAVVSAYGLSAGLTGLLAAGFADKFDRKKLLLFFYTGFIVGTVFCGLATSFETLLAARIITGVFGGVVGSILMAIVTDVFSLQQRGRVMGFIQMAFAGSQILGIPIGLYLARVFNWHMTFYMVVGIAVIVAILIAALLRPVTAHLEVQRDSQAWKHLWNTVRKKDYRIGFLATAMLSMGGFMLMPFSSSFLVNNIKIGQDKLELVFFYTGLSSMVIMPLIGKLSDRIDKFRLFTMGSLLAIVMVTIYTNLTPVPIAVVILVNMILFMGIMSRIVPATALNSALPGLQDRGAFMSVNASLQYIAGGIAAWVAGKIVYQASEHSPIERFDVLGYILSGLIIWCIYLMSRVSSIIKQRSAVRGN